MSIKAVTHHSLNDKFHMNSYSNLLKGEEAMQKDNIEHRVFFLNWISINVIMKMNRERHLQFQIAWRRAGSSGGGKEHRWQWWGWCWVEMMMMKAVTSVFWQNCSIPMHAPENISFIGMNSHKSAVPKPNLVNAQIPISSLHVNFTNTVQIYDP